MSKDNNRLENHLIGCSTLKGGLSTKPSNQLSVSSFYDFQDQTSEAQPQIQQRLGIQEEYSTKKNRLFDKNNYLDTGEEGYKATPPQLTPNSQVRVHRAVKTDFKPQRRGDNEQMLLIQESKLGGTDDLSKIQAPQRTPKQTPQGQQNKKSVGCREGVELFGSTSTGGTPSREQRINNNVSRESERIQSNNNSSSKHQQCSNFGYVNRSELPEIVNYLARNVIRTLEPLIDAYINERLLLHDQKLLELTNKIEYASKSLDLKFEIYQQSIQSQIHQLQLSSHHCSHSQRTGTNPPQIFDILNNHNKSARSHINLTQQSASSKERETENGVMRHFQHNNDHNSSFMDYMSRQQNDKLASSDFALSLSEATNLHQKESPMQSNRNKHQNLPLQGNQRLEQDLKHLQDIINNTTLSMNTNRKEDSQLIDAKIYPNLLSDISQSTIKNVRSHCTSMADQNKSTSGIKIATYLNGQSSNRATINESKTDEQISGNNRHLQPEAFLKPENRSSLKGTIESIPPLFPMQKSLTGGSNNGSQRFAGDRSSAIHLSSEFLGMSRDLKFLEMSDLLRTFTNNSIKEDEQSDSSSDAELHDEIDGTDESGINALNLSLSQVQHQM